MTATVKAIHLILMVLACGRLRVAGWWLEQASSPFRRAYLNRALVPFASLAVVSCAAGTNLSPDIALTPVSSFQEVGTIDGRALTILDAYFWRDWMPVVEHPGPDGGSPLYARIRFRVDNSQGTTTKLAFSAVVYDGAGQTYPIEFQAVPDPSGTVWDGTVAAGEDRVVEILTHEGPYLPVKSTISIVITFADGDGNAVSIRTLEGAIQRTD